MAWLRGLVKDGDRPASITVDDAYVEPPAGFDQCLVFDLSARDVNEHGFTTPAEEAHLDAVANDLEAAAGGEAVVVGAVLRQGVKTFVLYARDAEGAQDWLVQVEGIEPREATVALRPDPDWDLYHRLLADGRRAAADHAAWSALDPPPDPAEPRDVTWSVRYADPETADRAGRLLEGLDYRVTLAPPDPGGVTELAATLSDRVTMDFVITMSERFGRFAAQTGGSYTGWRA